MKKNLYYRHHFQRTNAFKDFFIEFLLSIASWPRLLLEVFIRKNFGERYFSLTYALLLFATMILAPVVIRPQSLMNYAIFGHMDVSFLTTVSENLTWYLFSVAFLLVSIVRESEIDRSFSTFDLARFSFSSGDIHPRFLAFYGDKPANFRTIETLIEPAFFFFIGLFLWWMDQGTGLLLMVCSVIYSLSYIAAYRKGDSFMLDQIDEMICNHNLAGAFIKGLDSRQTQGLRFIGRVPTDSETRRKVAETFFEEEEIEAR